MAELSESSLIRYHHMICLLTLIISLALYLPVSCSITPHSHPSVHILVGCVVPAHYTFWKRTLQHAQLLFQLVQVNMQQDMMYPFL